MAGVAARVDNDVGRVDGDYLLADAEGILMRAGGACLAGGAMRRRGAADEAVGETYAGLSAGAWEVGVECYAATARGARADVGALVKGEARVEAAGAARGVEGAGEMRSAPAPPLTAPATPCCTRFTASASRTRPSSLSNISPSI